MGVTEKYNGLPCEARIPGHQKYLRSLKDTPLEMWYNSFLHWAKCKESNGSHLSNEHSTTSVATKLSTVLTGLPV